MRKPGGWWRPLSVAVTAMMAGAAWGAGGAAAHQGGPTRAEAGEVPWQAEDPAIPWAGWLEQRPWLMDISSWFSYLDHSVEKPRRRNQGAFGMGNGRVFGLIGLGPTLNTLSNHTGPTYQSPESFFGDSSLEILDHGSPMPFTREWAWRTRGTAINGTLGQTGADADVRRRPPGDRDTARGQPPVALSTAGWRSGLAGIDETSPRQRTASPAAVHLDTDGAGDLELFTVDFVPPDQDALVRVLVVRNDGEADRADIGVRVGVRCGAGEGLEVIDGMAVQHRGDRSAWLAGVTGPATAVFKPDAEGLEIDLGPLPVGSEVTVAIAFAYTAQGDSARAASIFSTLRDTGPDALLEATRDRWNAWLEEAAHLEAPSTKVNDLYEGMQITMGVQTDAQGPVSPMSRYTKAWLRDTIGPLRFFTRIGRTGEARRMLDYLYKTSVLSQEIRNSVALAQDVSAVVDPADPETFWGEAELMPGRNPTEAPSYLPLEYGFYFRHTGDLELLRDRYDYLRVSATKQERTDYGEMMFSGDETFRYTLMLAMGILTDPTNVAWSSNSNFAYVGALKQLETLATRLGYSSDAAWYATEIDEMTFLTDALYWRDGRYYSPAAYFRSGDLVPYPFEDVCTKPLFFGYLEPDTDQARAMVDETVDYLMRDDGTLLTPSGLGGLENPGYDGMVPGLFLYNVAMTDHPAAETAFNALDTTASSSGSWEELHWKDNSALSLTHYPSGEGGDVAARYRPWEGGENVDAMLVYLTGLELDYPDRRILLAPHLPDGWSAMRMTDLAAGPAGKYDLEVARQEGMWTARLTSRAEEAFEVSIRFVEPGARWGSVTVNGAAWSDVGTDVVYDTQSRVVVRNARLEAGGALEVSARYE